MNPKTKLFGIFLICIFLGVTVNAYGADMVVINSADGRDIYSGVVYANTMNLPYKFLVDSAQKNILISGIDKQTHAKILLIESKNNPYVPGYKKMFEDAGFNVTEIISDDGLKLNLELARNVSTKKFILIDDTYGYNAVSVVPYAKISNSYVLFANKENIDGIYDLFSKVNPENILVYGFADDEVKKKISGFNHEILDKADRFDNNIEIVKRYREINPVRQVVLSDGTFLEPGMVSGEEPILFIGADSVPEQTMEYLAKTNIMAGTLVGNALTKPARLIRETLKNEYNKNFSVFVKFGKSTPAVTPGEIQVLDMFYLPSFPLNLAIGDIKYNDATKKLEVTYINNASTVAYFSPTINVKIDNLVVKTFGEPEPVLIKEGEFMGREYDLDLSAYDVRSANITARVSAEYGEGPRSLEKVVEKESLIAVISKQDASSVDVTGVVYDPGTQQLVLNVKNAGEVPVYFKNSVKIKTAEGFKILKKDDVEYLNVNEMIGVIYSGVPEIDTSEKVGVHIDYGDREEFMKKTLDKEYQLTVKGEIFPLWVIIIAALLLLFVLIILFIFRRKRSDEK